LDSWTKEELDIYNGWSKEEVYVAYCNAWKELQVAREKIKALNIKLAGERYDKRKES